MPVSQASGPPGIKHVELSHRLITATKHTNNALVAVLGKYQNERRRELKGKRKRILEQDRT